MTKSSIWTLNPSSPQPHHRPLIGYSLVNSSFVLATMQTSLRSAPFCLSMNCRTRLLRSLVLSPHGFTESSKVIAHQHLSLTTQLLVTPRAGVAERLDELRFGPGRTLARAKSPRAFPGESQGFSLVGAKHQRSQIFAVIKCHRLSAATYCK